MAKKKKKEEDYWEGARIAAEQVRKWPKWKREYAAQALRPEKSTYKKKSIYPPASQIARKHIVFPSASKANPQAAKPLPDLQKEINDLKAELEKYKEKAIRFELDQMGIEQREKEAEELIAARAQIVELEKKNEYLKHTAIILSKQVSRITENKLLKDTAKNILKELEKEKSK